MAEEVRVLMLRRGVKQSDLAAILGVNQAAVSHRLTGRTIFTVRELGIIAEYFGVSPVALLGAGNAEGPRSATPIEGLSEVVRHQGLEPRTRWFEASTPEQTPAVAIATVTPLFAGTRGRRHSVDIATRPLAPVVALGQPA